MSWTCLSRTLRKQRILMTDMLRSQRPSMREKETKVELFPHYAPLCSLRGSLCSKPEQLVFIKLLLTPFAFSQLLSDCFLLPTIKHHFRLFLTTLCCLSIFLSWLFRSGCVSSNISIFKKLLLRVQPWNSSLHCPLSAWLLSADAVVYLCGMVYQEASSAVNTPPQLIPCVCQPSTSVWQPPDYSAIPVCSLAFRHWAPQKAQNQSLRNPYMKSTLLNVNKSIVRLCSSHWHPIFS